MTTAPTHTGDAPKQGATARPLLVTIDGPAGAGKTTISRMLAERLDYDYIDTGALYRAVALAALDAGVAGDDDVALEKLCGNLELRFHRSGDDLRLFGRAGNGRTIRGRVTGDRDPGYGATCRMLGESAVCLATEGDLLPVAGGFWTPASCMGDALIPRLEASAGMRFERLPD